MKNILVFFILFSLTTLCFAAADSSAALKPSVASQAPDTAKKIAQVPDAAKKSGPILDTAKKTTPVQDTIKKTTAAPDTAKKTAAVQDTIKKTVAAQDTAKKAVVVQDTAKKIAAPQKFEEEDILVDETEQKKMAPAPALQNAQPGVPLGKDSLKNAGGKNPADTLNAAAKSSMTDSAVVATSKDSANVPMGRKIDSAIVLASIEPIRSINFAKNLKDYRSPKLAMLLSFLVPGLGQAYVKRYYKSAVFLALEATAIGMSVAYNNLGKNKNTEARNFADTNYSFENMNTYYTDLKRMLIELSANEEKPDSAGKAKIDNIYYDSLDAFKNSYNSKPRSQDYYSDIQYNTFVQGWKDCEPKLSEIQGANASFNSGHYQYRIDTLRYLVSRIDTVHGNVVLDSMLYGYSEQQLQFNGMMSKSNNYYKISQNILFALIINHCISAVDALISAKAYNDELIGKESVWKHISIEQQMVDAGSETASGIALKIRF